MRQCTLRALGVLWGAGALLGTATTPTAAVSQTGDRDGRAVPDSALLRLTPSEARALAQRQNPDWIAARQLPVIARGELQQAQTIRFNPDLSLIGGKDPQVTLTEEIEWAGQRGLRTTAARSGLTRAGLETAEVGRQTMADVTIAFYRALAASGRRQVVEQLVVLTERLIGAVRIQLKEGEISVLDANLGEIENGRVRARALGARRDAAAAELELKRMLGLAPNVALRLTDDSNAAVAINLDEDSLVAVAFRQRPDLGATAAEAEQARTLSALARREALPNVRVGGVVDPAAGKRGIGLALGASLPVFNRNRGTIAARETEARAAELRRIATRARVRSEVATAIASYRTATEELRLYSETVLEPGRTNASLLNEAYRAGKIPLPTLLLLRNQLLDAEFGYWDAWLIQREMRARLAAATGAPTPPIPATDNPPPAREHP